MRWIIVVQDLPICCARVRVNQFVGTLDLVNVVGLTGPFQVNISLVCRSDGGELQCVLPMHQQRSEARQDDCECLQGSFGSFHKQTLFSNPGDQRDFVSVAYSSWEIGVKWKNK